MNVNNSFASAPLHQRRIAASLRDVTGRRHSRTDLLIRFLLELQSQLALLERDVPQLVRDCRKYCILQGRTVECHVRERLVRGRCCGLGDDGALLVRTESGIERLFGGQVDLVP